MKFSVKSSDWIAVVSALHALTAPGAGPLVALMPLLGAAGGILAQLKRVFP
jgi:hypothetical protein